MQKLAEICIRRPVFATMIIMALVVTGAAAYLGLGVDRFPSVDIPQVRVRATLAGSAPEDMETEVAQRLEEAVNTIEGLDEILAERVASSRGQQVPRGVKRKTSGYKLRPRTPQPTTRIDFTVAIRIIK